MDATKANTSPAENTELDELQKLADAALRRHGARIKKQERLLANLRGDLEKHGDPELWKKYGDLLLASVSTAKREGDIIYVADLFAESAPLIAIEGERRKTLNEIAEEYFKKYTKARNGRRVIATRIASAEKGLADASREFEKLETAIASGDGEMLATLIERPKKQPQVSRKKKAEAGFKGARKFISSDGLEILVGRKAVDNDFLTFRIAKSRDLWLHAADYPGSHVVVRGSGRGEIPNTTLLEAAQLAAFYSDARGQLKAAVRYTERKFVNKPRKSAPGLVSLSSFKTILVEPKVPFEKE